MTTYGIEVSYRTGDSNGYSDEEGLLELRWNDLSKAKQALQRIKEHYRWYEDKEGWNPKNIPEPEWHKGIEYDFVLMLPLDDGTEMRYSGGMWCGYFERLYGAKIVVTTPNESDMEFTV